MESILSDLRYAVRVLRRSPAFTTVAVLTLALGVGATTAIFSVVNAVLFRPLPYPAADRIVQIWETAQGRGRGTVSVPNFVDVAAAPVFESAAAWSYATHTWLTGDGAQPLRGLVASAGLFPALGVAAGRGRTFGPDDDRPGAADVAVVSWSFWQGRLGAAPDVVGSDLLLDGRRHTVIGVMPAGFAYPDAEIAVITPLRADPAGADRGSRFLFAVGRLAPGTTPAGARTAVDAVAARLQTDHPDTNASTGFELVPLREWLVGRARTPLLVLLAAVGFVLLIACANVANLLVARASGRTSEVAVRRALGAGRARLARQFLMEGVLLASAGGVAGVLIAMWGVQLLVTLNRSFLPVGLDTRPDTTVLAVTLGALVLIAAALGAAQASLFARPDQASALREGARGLSGDRGRLRTRSALAVAQVALALPLLAGAALLTQTLHALTSVPTGFRADGVLTLRLELPAARYAGAVEQAGFAAALTERVAALPGVVAAGLTADLPFGGSRTRSTFTIDGEPAPAPGEAPAADRRHVSADYFHAMDMTVLAGRGITARDAAGSPPVVVVNETFARRWFAGGDAVGRRITVFDESFEIVGIVGDVMHDNLRGAPEPEFYLSLGQMPQSRLFLAVRTASAPAALAPAARAAVADIDPELAAFAVRTMEERLASHVAPERGTLGLLALFAGLAVTLAVIGLYGVLSYAIAQRVREFGIRMALGARPADVTRQVLGHGLRLVGVGLALGVAAALALGRTLEGMLFGVQPADGRTLIAVVGLLTCVALAACWLPARRATRLDPMRVLRSD